VSKAAEQLRGMCEDIKARNYRPEVEAQKIALINAVADVMETLHDELSEGREDDECPICISGCNDHIPGCSYLQAEQIAEQST